MSNIGELFHSIANWHNKITIGAGCSRRLLSAKPLYTLSEKELRAKHNELLELLDRLEQDAVSANKKVEELKGIIYQILDPQTGKPK